MKQNINDSLSILGLTEEEIQVFIALSQHHTSVSATELSKETNIPRTTVYRIIENLVDKNLIRWIIGERGKEVEIVSPDNLDILIKNKKQELEGLTYAVEQMKQFLTQEVNNNPTTKVRYYTGKEGIKQILWNSLQADEEIIGYSEHERKKVVGETFSKRYSEEFTARQLQDRSITNEETLNHILESEIKSGEPEDFDDVRIIPKETFYVSGDTSIYNNTYAVCWWNQGEVVGVEIENPELVKLQKSIFEHMWQIAKPVSDFI